MSKNDRKPTAALGERMIAGLSELAAIVESGEPVASRFRVRTVRYDRDEGRYEVIEHGASNGRDRP